MFKYSSNEVWTIWYIFYFLYKILFLLIIMYICKVYIYIKEREYKIYNIIKYFLIILFSNFNLFIYIVY